MNPLKFILPLIFICLNILGQSKSAQSCERELKGFICDTQEYLIKANENSTYDVIFYPEFTYRLKLCTTNKNIKLNIQLIDEKENIQFNNNINIDFFRDFKFETIFHGKIIIKPLNNDSQPAQIIIGYKKN